MLGSDVELFTALLAQLCLAFGRDQTDALRELYWQALSDLPLPVIRARVEYHLRNGKHFPRPVELRPPDAKAPPAPVLDGASREAHERAIRNLEALRREQPARWLELVRPKVHELGALRGLSRDQVEGKLHRALEAA